MGLVVAGRRCAFAGRTSQPRVRRRPAARGAAAAVARARGPDGRQSMRSSPALSGRSTLRSRPCARSRGARRHRYPPAALARNPQSHRTRRGCCIARGRARRRAAADVLASCSTSGTSPSVRRRRDRRLRRRVRRRPHAQPPRLRCNERIKFQRRARPRRPFGFDAVATGHYARLVDGPTARELHRAGRRGQDQSYVLAVLDEEQLPARCSPGRHGEARRCAAEAAPRPARRRQARQPRHLLHPRRRHRGFLHQLGIVARRRRRRHHWRDRPPPGRVMRSPSAAPRARARRPRQTGGMLLQDVVGVDVTTSTGDGRSARAARGRHRRWGAAALVQSRARRPGRGRCSCAHGVPVAAVVSASATRSRRTCAPRVRGIAPRGRRWSSTTARASSAARRPSCGPRSNAA